MKKTLGKKIKRETFGEERHLTENKMHPQPGGRPCRRDPRPRKED